MSSGVFLSEQYATSRSTHSIDGDELQWNNWAKFVISSWFIPELTGCYNQHNYSTNREIIGEDPYHWKLHESKSLCDKIIVLLADQSYNNCIGLCIGTYTTNNWKFYI